APHLQEPRHDELPVDEAMVHEARVDDARVDESRIDEADVNEPPVYEPHVHEPHVHEPRAEGPRAGEQPMTLLGEDHTRKSPRPTATVPDSAKKPPSMTERRAELGTRGGDIPTATPPP